MKAAEGESTTEDSLICFIELLKKEREAEKESSKYVAASPGSNIDDKIKGSLKSIQESIGLEVV